MKSSPISLHDTCHPSAVMMSELRFDIVTVVYYDVTGLTSVVHCDVHCYVYFVGIYQLFAELLTKNAHT